MKIATIFTLSIISFQAFCVDNYIEEQIKKLSSHDKEIRKDGAHRLDSYWTSNGAKTDPKEIDKYITELKKSLKDPESAVVQFITHIMGANPMVDQKTNEVYYYVNRTTPEIRKSIINIMVENLSSKDAWISSRSASTLINSSQCEYETQIRDRIALSTSFKFMFKEQLKKLNDLCK